MARDRGPHLQKRFRVELCPLPGAEPLANVWVSVSQPDSDGRRFFTLDRQYPDLQPSRGWVILHQGQSYLIASATGVALLASPLREQEARAEEAAAQEVAQTI